MERQTSTGDKIICANHIWDSTGTQCIRCGYNKIDEESFSNVDHIEDPYPFKGRYKTRFI